MILSAGIQQLAAPPQKAQPPGKDANKGTVFKNILSEVNQKQAKPTKGKENENKTDVDNTCEKEKNGIVLSTADCTNQVEQTNSKDTMQSDSVSMTEDDLNYIAGASIPNQIPFVPFDITVQQSFSLLGKDNGSDAKDLIKTDTVKQNEAVSPTVIDQAIGTDSVMTNQKTIPLAQQVSEHVSKLSGEQINEALQAVDLKNETDFSKFLNKTIDSTALSDKATGKADFGEKRADMIMNSDKPLTLEFAQAVKATDTKINAGNSMAEVKSAADESSKSELIQSVLSDSNKENKASAEPMKTDFAAQTGTDTKFEVKAETKTDKSSGDVIPKQKAAEIREAKAETVNAEKSESEAITEKSDNNNDIFKATADISGNFTVQNSSRAVQTEKIAAKSEMQKEQPVYNQISEKVTNAVKENQVSFKMKLNPEGLGQLVIDMTYNKGGSLTLNIQSSVESTQLLLKDQIGQLQAALKESSLNITDYNIKVAGNEEAQNLNYYTSFTDSGFRDSYEQQKTETYAGVKYLNNTQMTNEDSEVKILPQLLYTRSVLNYRI